LKKKSDSAAHVLRMLRVLPFVPTESIAEAFHDIADYADKHEQVNLFKFPITIED
jgi:hypothetical protein